MAQRHVVLLGANGSSGAQLFGAFRKLPVNLSVIRFCGEDENEAVQLSSSSNLLEICVKTPVRAVDIERLVDEAEENFGPVTNLVMSSDFPKVMSVRTADVFAFAGLTASTLVESMLARGDGHVTVINSSRTSQFTHICATIQHWLTLEIGDQDIPVGLQNLTMEGDAKALVEDWLKQQDQPTTDQSMSSRRTNEQTDQESQDSQNCRIISSRTAFDKIIAKETARSSRYNRPVCLIRSRVDHYERFQSVFGGKFSGAIGSLMVKACQLQLRNSDSVLVGKAGEMDILLPETDIRAAREVFEKISAWLSRSRFKIDDRRVTFSLILDSAVTLNTQKDLADGFVPLEEMEELSLQFV